MEYFRQKDRLVVGGNMTESPGTINCNIVVLCETVRVALTLEVFND